MARAKMESNMDMMELMERFGTEEKCRVILGGHAGISLVCTFGITGVHRAG